MLSNESFIRSEFSQRGERMDEAGGQVNLKSAQPAACVRSTEVHLPNAGFAGFVGGGSALTSKLGTCSTAAYVENIVLAVNQDRLQTPLPT